MYQKSFFTKKCFALLCTVHCKKNRIVFSLYFVNGKRFLKNFNGFVFVYVLSTIRRKLHENRFINKQTL